MRFVALIFDFKSVLCAAKLRILLAQPYLLGLFLTSLFSKFYYVKPRRDTCKNQSTTFLRIENSYYIFFCMLVSMLSQAEHTFCEAYAWVFGKRKASHTSFFLSEAFLVFLKRNEHRIRNWFLYAQLLSLVPLAARRINYAYARFCVFHSLYKLNSLNLLHKNSGRRRLHKKYMRLFFFLRIRYVALKNF